MRQRIYRWFTLLAVVFIVATHSTSSEAVLKSFGPLNFAGFPAYYQDANGLGIQQCLSLAVSPVTGLPICGLLAFPGTTPPFVPTLPVTFPPNPPTGFNFPLEGFYLSAQPPPAFKNLAPGAGKVLILNNLEGSFANNINPVPGDQIVFSRVRIWLLGTPSGRYTITHPYGVDVMDVIQADIKTQKMTRDIGLVGVRFTGALLGDIGPFLKWTPDPALIAAGTQNADGTISAVNPLTGAPEVYVGDPNIPHPFTGSPFGTNFWRVDGPPGSGIGGPGIDFIQSTDAIIIGQKFTAPIPSPLAVDRATYGRSGLTGAMDIFATTSPISNAPPALSALTVSGTGITTTAMTGNPAGNFFSHIITATPNLIPPTVTVTNTADVPPSTFIANLVDEVTITKAIYNVATQTLSIQASSADKFLNPALTALGLGPLDPVTGILNVVTPTPPPAVTVQSSARGTATLPVTTAVNIPPVANNDAATTPSGSATSIFITANDTDVDGFINPATVTIVTPALHGTAVAQPNGTVNYSPNPGYVSPAGVPDTFTYTVQDNLGAVSNVATVTVTVTAAIAPPIAAADIAVTQIGTPVVINVIANDTAPGGFINPSTVSVVSGPLNGTAVANANGTVTYTPTTPAFVGTNTFSYVVSNNLNALSNVATVTVTVTALNAVPIAVNDTASTASGLSANIPVLANDTPLAALNPASVLIVTAPLNGTAIANPDGTVTYTPTVGYTGTNTFTYSVRDSFGTVSNAATVTITVASNVPPVANADTAVTSAGVVVPINVLANDVASVGNTLNPATVTVAGLNPLQGSTTVAPLTGIITFTPAALFTGVSTFTYTVADSRGVVSNAATVSVTVTSAPTAAADTATTPSGVPVIINVLANDSAAIGSSLNLASVVATAPAFGTAIVNALTGEITYTPTAIAPLGTDTFTYTVKDNLGVASAPATVTITITVAGATAPVAGNDTVIIPVGTVAIPISVLANDTAVAGTLLTPASVTIAGITTPQGTTTIDPLGVITYTPTVGLPTVQGTATVAPLTGIITFTPAVGFIGTSTFAYTVSDNSIIPVVSNAATVTVTVTALPTANADAATTPNGVPVTINVLANDTAAPGNSLNPASVLVAGLLAAQGTTTVNTATGAITFTQGAGFTGTTTFTYTVNDNLGAVSAPATVTVTAANVPPVANNDTATATAGGAAVTINVLTNDIATPGNTLNPATVLVAGLAAAQGSTTVSAAGIISFAPAVTFTGTSFTYTVKDNLGTTSNAAIVTVSPAPVVVPPVANNDLAVAQSGIATLFSVVANDAPATPTNSAINPATVTIVNAPLHGTAVANASGIVTYTSTPVPVTLVPYVGPDSFTYTVKDLLGVTSNVATVNVTVNAVTPPPTAVADAAVTTAGIAATINVIANDTAPGSTINPASIFIITPPLHGTAVAQPNGTLVYTPALGYVSPAGPPAVPDTFTYTVRNNLGVVSNPATVSVTVNPATALVAPTATNDAASTNKNAPVTINVLVNDTAAVGHTLAPATVFVVTQPLNGTAAANTLGVVTFTPALNFVGTTTFTYNVKDNLGTTSNTATVTVTVLPVNIPPVALNASAAMLAGVNPNVAIPVTALVSDIDGTVNIASLAVTQPAAGRGTATLSALTPGVITYTPPNAAFTGVVTFTYTVLDNLGAISNAATVTVTINAATVETLTITRAFFQLAGSNWRVDGTTSARVLGETVQIFNSPTAPAVGTVGLLMTANVDLAGVWTQVAKPGPAPASVPPRVSIRTSLGNILNNIPVVLR